MSTGRLETFADGVFAIAATLLILNVDAHIGNESKDLAHDLLTGWSSYAAYALSFVTIGIIWVNHHTVMTQIDRADRIFLFLTVGFLMCVAFIPFPTRLIAEYLTDDFSNARAATITFGITLSVTAAFFNALWLYASRSRRLLREDADETLVLGITKSFRPGVPTYVAATLVGIVNPLVSFILYTVIATIYVVESSVFARFRRSSRTSNDG
jgi:TMEM175 potassium channel family protein